MIQGRNLRVLMVGLLSALSLAGCKQNKFIEKVTFKPSDNLEVVRVSLVFTPKVQADLGGGFSLKTYGYLFLNPYTASQRFEIGFDLNTSIVNEQDYVHLAPTEVLPNGMPIGLDHPLVEIRSPNPISNKFDLYGYVDVLRLQWLGVSTMFGFIDEKNFPPGLSVSEAFLRNSAGIPAVQASVFGPTVDSDGNMVRSGGIALFANVRQLLDNHIRPGAVTEAYPTEDAEISGPGAEEYRRDPRKLERLQSQLIRAFNTQK